MEVELEGVDLGTLLVGGEDAGGGGGDGDGSDEVGVVEVEKIKVLRGRRDACGAG